MFPCHIALAVTSNKKLNRVVRLDFALFLISEESSHSFTSMEIVVGFQ